MSDKTTPATTGAQAPLDFAMASKPWTALPEDARTKFTAWMNTDPTGQALAAEAAGDLDYAVWLIAAELNCHMVLNQPFTALTDVGWRALYDAGRTPAQAIADTVKETR